MGAADQRTAIGTLFYTNWNQTPVAWPNRGFTPTTGQSWVRLTIRNAETREMEFGATNPQRRTTGVVIVEVFAPMDDGDAAALALADSVAAIFVNNRRVAAGVTGDVRFRAPTIQPLGPDPAGGGWYKVNVNVPFWHDSV